MAALLRALVDVAFRVYDRRKARRTSEREN